MANYFNFLRSYALQSNKAYKTHKIWDEYNELQLTSADAISFQLGDPTKTK
jgi:hypothetical protein